jgi:uncharacterized protein (TIGR01244 family)
MADIRRVTPEFSVAPQLAPQELETAAAQGFKLVINNRPDGEAPDQPPGAVMEAAAKAAGLSYIHIPVSGMPRPDQIEAMQAAIAEAGGPVLAYCRSGTRSITTWALGEAARDARPRNEIVELAAEAGYDLSPLAR